MQPINNLLIDGLKDFRSAIDQGKQQSRQYFNKEKLNYNPTNARFKLVVWFKDGRNRWYFSFDNVHIDKQVHQDEWNGIKKLIRLAEIQYKGQFKNAIIYGNLTPNKSTTDFYDYEIIKWNWKGEMKENKFVNFIKGSDQKSIIFDFDKLKTYGNKKIG
jgi:hypothetical protein